MAQHINKQNTDVSSTINALKTIYQTWGVTPRDFDATAQPREKIDEL